MSKESRALRRAPRIEPVGVLDFLGTVNANGEPSLTFAQRHQRCFELATFAVVFGTAPRDAQLVHDSWHGPGAPARIPHAWVLLADGSVWEPIRARLYADRAAWYHWTAARDEVAYAGPLAQRLTLQHQHYGPWHRPPVRLEERAASQES